MNTVDATFIIPPHVALGLSNGSLERVGGVVREIKSKQVVTWLRENLKRDSVISDSSILSSATAAVDNLSTVVNN
jgi:hypothetical protein